MWAHHAARGACLATAIAANGVVAVLLMPAKPRAVDVPPIPSTRLAAAVTRDSLGVKLQAAARQWPFRMSRTAPGEPLTPGVLRDQAPIARPTLGLAGMILADSPGAIVLGIPGQAGSTVLRRGEAASGIRLQSVSESGVVLSGFDTTWTLSLKELE